MDSINATYFLSAAPGKALLHYASKAKNDINKFIYKLQNFLNHPSIDNCHLESLTTKANKTNSLHLASLLSMCLSENALSTFINNSKFDSKGVEMLQHLIDMKHLISKLLALTIYDAMIYQTIVPDNLFDTFTKRLCLIYKTCMQSDIPYDGDFSLNASSKV